jgi:pSer/pThr/pTyr-binding forkhead associated (FHA) protein
MKLCLHVMPAPGASFNFRYSGTVVRIGRDPAGEIVFQDPRSQAVSWHHACIELAPAEAWLRDLGSTNGTIVNGERVSGKVSLKVGDRIQVGFTGPAMEVTELESDEMPSTLPTSKLGMRLDFPSTRTVPTDLPVTTRESRSVVAQKTLPLPSSSSDKVRAMQLCVCIAAALVLLGLLFTFLNRTTDDKPENQVAGKDGGASENGKTNKDKAERDKAEQAKAEQAKAEELKKIKEANEVEIKKIKEANEAEIKKIKEANEAEIKKQEEARAAEMKKFQEANAAELKKLEEARAMIKPEARPFAAPPPPLQAFQQPIQQALAQPAAQTQAALVQQQQPAGFALPPPGTTSGTAYPAAYDPAGSRLNGIANVRTATGQYYQQVQQARLLNEQVFSAQIDNRRKLLEERRYEKSLIPNPEDVRMAEMAGELRRSRNEPPPTEVWSGKAMNDLFNSIKRTQLTGLRGPTIPLDEDQVRQLNLITGTTAGNVGLLKNGGNLEWPFVFKMKAVDKLFEGDRKTISDLAQRIAREGAAGQLSDDAVGKFGEAVTVLGEKVDEQVKEMTPTQFVQASRYVNELKGAVKALQQDANVLNQFNGKYQPRGKTVSDLVDMMISNSLKFAPASRGAEPAYSAVYRALLSYDLALSQYASK